MTATGAATRSARRQRDWIWIAAAALILGALIVGVHRESPRTAISAHGLLHAAIVDRIADAPCSLPPENPFFAGEPLRYYWFFHALAAGLGARTGLSALRSLELCIVLGSLALFPLAGRLALGMYGRALPGLWIGLLVVIGAKPFAALVAAHRVAGHDPLLQEASYLWGVAHPLLGAMRLFDPQAMWGPLLNFFFNITSRPLAIVSLLAMVLALHAVLARGGAARALGLALATASCSAFSVLFGASGAGALAAGVATLALVARRARNGDENSVGASIAPRAPLAIAALLGGLALAAPSYWQLLGNTSTGATGAGPLLTVASAAGQGRALLAMAESACLTLPLALWAAWTARGAQRDFLLVLLLASGAFALAAATTRLPIGSQNNFFQAGLVPLGVAASAALVDRVGRTRPRRTAAVLAVFAPGAALIVFAYTGRPAVPVALEGAQLVRTPPDAQVPQLYDWIRTATEPRAVFVIEPEVPTRAIAGNTAELPALTGRALFTLRDSHYIVSGYADLARRTRIATALVHAVELDAADREYLAALGRPLYIVSDRLPGGRSPEILDRLEALHGRALRRAGPIHIYRYRPDHGAVAGRAS